MKRLQGLFANVLMVVLLLILIGGVAITLGRRASDDNELLGELTAQEVRQDSPIATPTSPPEVVKASPTPTLLPETTEPDFEVPVEPTWTPMIIMPKGTPPPIPTPLPTPTSTPINPEEKELIAFDIPASIGGVSPDGKLLAFNLLQTDTKQGVNNRYTQVWIMDLETGKTTKLAEVGRVYPNRAWSPNGQTLAYQIADYMEMEVRIIDLEERDDRSLLKSKDLLGYYWVDEEHLALLNPARIDQVDLTGQVKNSSSVSVFEMDVEPDTTNTKPKIVGSSKTDAIVINQDRQLLIKHPNGQVFTIKREENESIYEFELAPDGQQIAFLISNHPNAEVWVSDMTGEKQRKLFELKDQHFGKVFWSPDSKGLIVGRTHKWAQNGMADTGFDLIWVDIESGQPISLGVDRVVYGNLSFSPDGQYLYYNRRSFEKDTNRGESTFYQLRMPERK